MSTRCVVDIVEKDKKIKLYHHHDGYPSGVGFDLLNRFIERLSSRTIYGIDEVVNELVKDVNDEYEVTCYTHPDVEYWYEIDCARYTIKCWEVEHDWDNDTISKGEKINILDLYEEYLKKDIDN